MQTNINSFFQTAIGKAVKVAVFAGVSAAIASLQVHVSTEQGVGFALVNSLLVFVEGWLKPTVPTFPGDNTSSVTNPVPNLND